MSLGAKRKITQLVFNDFQNDSRVEKTCQTLASAGYSVTVFAFGGKGLRQKENRGNWEVFRFGSGNFFTAFISLCKFVLFNAWKTGVVHCNDLEPLPLAVMIKLLNFGKTSIVYDAHELETEKLAAQGTRKKIYKLLERCLVPFVDEIVTVSESIVRWYKMKYPARSPSLVLNVPRTTKIVDSYSLRKRLGVSGQSKLFLYLGGLSAGRSVEAMLQTFSAMKAQSLVFMGSGGTSNEGKRLERLVREESTSSIYYLKPVPQGEVVNWASSADVGLCLIEDRCLSYRYCLPNKLFEYAMAGLPMLVSDLPEMRKLVEKYNCGVICESITPKGIAKGIKKLLDQDLEKLGKNARKMAEDHSWEMQEKKLLRLYEKVLEKKAA